MYFLLFNTAKLLINICSTAIDVGRSSQRLSEGSSNMYQKALKLASFNQIDRPFLFLANLPITLSAMTLLLVNTFWTINCASFNTMMLDSLYLPLVALPFIFTFWKLLSLKHFNLISADKKNSFTSLKSFISALDFDWPFSRLIKFSVPFDDAHRTQTVSVRFHSDDLP